MYIAAQHQFVRQVQQTIVSQQYGLGVNMYDQIIAVYPELTFNDFINGTIMLQDDSDGKGPYIREWNYSKPLPAGLKLGK